MIALCMVPAIRAKPSCMKFLKPIALLSLLLLIGWIFYLPSTRAALFGAAQWAETEPLLASPLYIIFLVVAVVLMFPVWGVLMISGYLFGFFAGSLLAWVGYQIGAYLAFMIARTVGRGWVQKTFANNKKFTDFESAVNTNGIKTIILARFILIFPTNLINLFGGISAIDTKSFVAATAIGSIPMVLIYTYLGAKSSNLINSLADGTFVPPALSPMLLIAIGSVALVIILIMWRRTRNKNPL